MAHCAAAVAAKGCVLFAALTGLCSRRWPSTAKKGFHELRIHPAGHRVRTGSRPPRTLRAPHLLRGPQDYEEHAKEMGFTGREPPFFLLKPADAIVSVAAGETGQIPYPSLTTTSTTRSNWSWPSARVGATSRLPTPPGTSWLCGGPGHDPTRPSGRDEEAGSPLVHWQGL